MASPAALAVGAHPDRATQAELDRAQAEYRAGLGHFKTGEYRAAAEAFRRSYDIVASPNSHMMWAKALRDAGEYDRAYEEMALAQREASRLAIELPKYASTAESTEAELVELRPRVASVSIQVKNGEVIEVWVNRRKVRRALWPAVAVAEGQAHVVVRLPGGRRAWRAVEAKRGQQVKVDLDLAGDLQEGPREVVPWLAPEAPSTEPAAAEPPQAPPEEGGAEDRGAAPPQNTSHSLRPWAYVAGGVGAAGLLTFAIAGSLSSSTHSDLESACPDASCPQSEQDTIDKGKRQQTIANVGLAVGLVGAAAGATLFYLDLSGSSGQARRERRMVVSSSGIRLEGRF